MIAEYLIADFAKRCRKVRKQIGKPEFSRKEGKIHRLRLSIKRIKSIGRLAEELVPGEYDRKEGTKEMRKLYKVMGELRDVQVQEQLLEDYEERRSEDYLRLELLLKEDRKYARKKLDKFISKFDAKALKGLEEPLEEVLGDLNDARILERGQVKVTTLFKSIEEDLEAAEKDLELLHDIRSRLKVCLYIFKTLNKATGAAVWPQDFVAEVERVTDLAGDWHDREVLSARMKKLHRSDDSQYWRRQPYARFRKALKKETKARRSELMGLIGNLCQMLSTEFV